MKNRKNHQDQPHPNGLLGTKVLCILQSFPEHGRVDHKEAIPNPKKGHLARDLWMGYGLFLLVSPFLLMLLIYGPFLLISALTPEPPEVTDAQLVGTYTCSYPACQGTEVQLNKNGTGVLVQEKRRTCHMRWSRDDNMDLQFKCTDPIDQKLVNAHGALEKGNWVYNIRVPLVTRQEDEGIKAYFCVFFGGEDMQNCFVRIVKPQS